MLTEPILFWLVASQYYKKGCLYLTLKVSLTSFQASPANFTSVGSESTHLGVIEDFVASEEIFLNGFFNVLSQVVIPEELHSQFPGLTWLLRFNENIKNLNCKQ